MNVGQERAWRCRSWAGELSAAVRLDGRARHRTAAWTLAGILTGHYPSARTRILIRDGVDLEPVVYGGGQEHGLWGGTENVALAVALGAAADLAAAGLAGGEPERIAGTHRSTTRSTAAGSPRQAAVSALAAAGRDGGVLELGAGAGRLAIPLAARGIRVDGIEASQAMIEQLRSRPGSSAVGIIIADLAGFDLPYRDYTAAAASLLASNSDVRP